MSKMKNVHLVIGEGACGKSSLVRALTGKGRYGSVSVGLKDGSEIQVAVWVRSAQESGYSPQDVLNHVNSSVEEDVLLTLRFGTYNGQPHAEEYLRILMPIIKNLKIAFIGEGSTPNTFAVSGAQVTTFGHSWSTPANVVSHHVSDAWDWM